MQGFISPTTIANVLPAIPPGTYAFSTVGSAIDGTALATTTVFTTENNARRFYPTGIDIRLSAVDTPISVATLSVGTNSATFNNILAASALTGLTTLNDIFQIPLTGLIPSIAPNTAVKIKVTIAAVSTGYTIVPIIRGYYV